MRYILRPPSSLLDTQYSTAPCSPYHLASALAAASLVVSTKDPSAAMARSLWPPPPDPDARSGPGDALAKG